MVAYYFAYKLNSKVEDVDFSSADFISCTNSDLVGKYVNIASRSAGFLVKRFEGRVSDPAIAESSLIAEIKAAAPDINASFEGREYGKALRAVMELCQQSQRIRRPKKQPWELAKQPERELQSYTLSAP